MIGVPKLKGPSKNAKRKASHARAYGAKRAWIQGQPCCACGYPQSEAAHVGSGGMGRKADSTMLVPLCGKRQKFPDDPKRYGWFVQGCHAESHRGVKTFEFNRNVDLHAEAERYETQWQLVAGVAP